jgi:hypothetical protein
VDEYLKKVDDLLAKIEEVKKHGVVTVGAGAPAAGGDAAAAPGRRRRGRGLRRRDRRRLRLRHGEGRRILRLLAAPPRRKAPVPQGTGVFFFP